MDATLVCRLWPNGVKRFSVKSAMGRKDLVLLVYISAVQMRYVCLCVFSILFLLMFCFLVFHPCSSIEYRNCSRCSMHDMHGTLFVCILLCNVYGSVASHSISYIYLRQMAKKCMQYAVCIPYRMCANVNIVVGLQLSFHRWNVLFS